jgi:hypothetical protein
MFGAFAEKLRRWFGGGQAAPPASGGGQGSAGSGASALEVMQQMKAERATPADGAAWREGVRTFEGRVFSGMDRSRLWRRARRRYPGEVLELELISAPTTHDLAALQDLLRELQR